MARYLTPRRRTYDESEEEEEHVDIHEEVESSGSKRRRLNGDRSSASASPILPNSWRSDLQQSRIDALNGVLNGDTANTATFAPGSIVRVKLINFVTYTSAEFHPGPSLNMIIGPNGTGKSTLVCAICLGLGWKPDVLGRAKELGEFVRHGQREAEIEIELAAGGHGERNPIIRRTIKREGNKSSWHLNGSATTAKEIFNICKKFSIQINNLCQFLPQDRVAEFAAMNPEKLLVETQRAAASAEMTAWHEQLIKLRQDQQKEEGSKAQDEETLKNLQARQNTQRADVERLQERKKIVAEVEALKLLRPYIEYTEARNKYNACKEQVGAANEELKDLEESVQPSMQAVNDKKDHTDQIEKVVRFRKRNVERMVTLTSELYQKYKNVCAEIDDMNNKKKSEMAGDKGRKADLQRTLQDIRRVEQDMEQEPIEFDPAHYNELIRGKERQQRDIDAQKQEADRELHQCTDTVRRINSDLARYQKEKENLGSQTGQQFAKLKSASSDTAQAWQWVQDHRELFQDRIFGPAIVECSVKDSRYANAIESALQVGDFLAFTCTNSHDFKLLQNKLYKEMKLSDVTLRVANRTLDSWQPPVSDELLHGFGLTGWLSDFLDGPEPILSMLCDNAQLHRTGVTLGEQTDAQFERLTDSAIQRWVTNKSTYRVNRRREYGPSAVSTNHGFVRPARFWTDQAVDVGAEQEIDTNITRLRGERDHVRTSMYEPAKKAKQDCEGKTQALEGEINALKTEKDQKQRAFGAFQALPNKLNTFKEKLQSLEEAGTSYRERMAEINASFDGLVQRQGQASLDYVMKVEALRKLHFELYEVEVLHIEAKSEYEALVEENLAVLQTLEDKQRSIQNMQSQLDALKKYAVKLQNTVKRLQEEKGEELLAAQEEAGADITMDDLDALITSKSTRLEFLEGGNPDAIRQFERRQEEINILEERLRGLEDKVAGKQAQITELRERWEPELDGLIQKISDAFSHNMNQIGCAGEVGIYKSEEFADWSVQIRVKFREQEPLSLLTSQRQSGGERAVSTIFYLMSLQSLARSPFRVVDEINQGMDPRNERMVHKRMVEIACSENTSQYFLITPKLLSGLEYRQGMKVHCIASGEWMPNDGERGKGEVLDFARLADRALQIRGKA